MRSDQGNRVGTRDGDGLIGVLLTVVAPECRLGCERTFQIQDTRGAEHDAVVGDRQGIDRLPGAPDVESSRSVDPDPVGVNHGVRREGPGIGVLGNLIVGKIRKGPIGVKTQRASRHKSYSVISVGRVECDRAAKGR